MNTRLTTKPRNHHAFNRQCRRLQHHHHHHHIVIVVIIQTTLVQISKVSGTFWKVSSVALRI